MTIKAEHIIVGAGITGLATAYHLALSGCDPEKIIILESSYPGAGATCRCGGGIRQQWDSKENIIVARESVKDWEQLGEILDCDIHFHQGGYLILGHNDEDEEKFRRNVALQKTLGVTSRLLSVDEATEIVPGLSRKGIACAAFNQTDGTAYPFAVVRGFEKYLRGIGVRILAGVEVKSLSGQEGSGGTSVKSGYGSWHVSVGSEKYSSDNVLLAAGAYTAGLAGSAGVYIPTKPYRHEILATEPVKRFLSPMIISFRKGIYFSQSYRGEIIGGIGDPNEPSSFETSGTHRFMTRFSRVACEILPMLSGQRILRQWAGLYDVSPDAKPIIDEVLPGLYVGCGYSGHGFMIAPAVGKMLAGLMQQKKHELWSDSYSLSRFKNGEYEKETSVVG